MMRNRQTGMTAIGFILVVVVLGLIGFGVIQLVPVYLENMKILQVLNQTKTNLVLSISVRRLKSVQI